MRMSAIGLAIAVAVGTSVSGAAAFEVYGDIAKKWQQLGGAAGPLGQPMSDESDAAGRGRFNNFQYGFIYWRPRLGAFAVYGLIGEMWNAMGRERGPCGYPTTDEFSIPAGRRNNFQNGYITWHNGQRQAVEFCTKVLIDDPNEGLNPVSE